MAILQPPTPPLHLTTTTQFPSPPATYSASFSPPKPSPFTTRATNQEDTSDPTPQPESDSDPFESRLAQVRLRYRSGTGKKAELRKSKKTGAAGSATASAGKPGMYLPPVPLKEPESGGLKVEFGFSPYSERVNGRIAVLGLTALVAVELATGRGVINYHSPAIVLIQVYFVAAVVALYLKYEKESVSVWPLASPPSNEENQNV